ncbi:sensor histidine kinase [Dyadobacter psychrotolerans]|uniref:histidine kinase n=1 Tax=Dyadobacter psychrotolerans TaxID=2541721 RepID=A0A4R5DRP4_9BACT|nr:HAMP domain-containing sensor histidine kinase [Dyadobacter psychrotolerans]TDE14731.1 HAMP domain-containing histidine kinase [Dyadobacter psychrotolerans]
MTKTLEQKNTRYLLIWLPLVLLAGSVSFYVMLVFHAHHMQQKQLELKQANIWKAFTLQPESMPQHVPGEYDIDTSNRIDNRLPGAPKDTNVYNPETKLAVDFVTLTRYLNWKGKSIQLTTYVSAKEVSHLIIKVFLAEIVIFLLLLVAIVVVNRKSSQTLWQPFYSTLKKAGAYDVVRNPLLQLETQTGITEFNQLNEELHDLIEKVNKVYTNQKQFVENASHEMQTPLAIIRSKMEFLINDPALTERTAALLADITAANERLSQLNKSLLLLAKIDSNQFPQVEQVNISKMLEKILENYQQHYENFPALTKSIQSQISIVANLSLFEILLSNLVGNAVVHNIAKGRIHVELDNKKLVITNTGNEITGDPEQLFERFKKGNDASKTTGLGLALVKQITQLYQLKLRYQYEKTEHRITVFFN